MDGLILTISMDSYSNNQWGNIRIILRHTHTFNTHLNLCFVLSEQQAPSGGIEKVLLWTDTGELHNSLKMTYIFCVQIFFN